MTALLRLTDVRFHWPGQQRPVLDLPELTLAAGERVFVMGPSGCGKTSLLSLIAGIAVPQQGTVTFAGQVLNRLSGRRRDCWRADQVGVVFQLFNLLPYLSARDNVLLAGQFSPLRRQRAGASPAARQAEAERLLDSLGLPATLFGQQAMHLSVGQQQRVALARALYGQPRLVLADEPTSALDAEHRDQFMTLLHRECERAGAALLFVSHDLSLADHFDRQWLLPALNRAAGGEP
mgnify:CR=1 FL=1